MWDHSPVTLAKCRNLKFVKDKFQGSPDVVKSLCGSSTDSYLIIFHQVSLKGGGLNLVELFDQARHLSCHFPWEFRPVFACESILAYFLNSQGNTFDLHPGDEGSLAYLACVSPSRLPVPSLSGPKYTHYSAHRILWQIGFNQDIPLVFKDIVPSIPFLDPFLRLQAFSYWSRRDSQFVVPNSQRKVFASSGFAGYWRRVQKSFSDYVGSGKIGRVPNPNILSALTTNRCLSLATAGIVSTVISNKTGFAKWHASRGGWVCYAQDFPETWSGCDLIVGTSSGVPIKRGTIEAIGAATRIGKGAEKKIKQEKVKRAELEESNEGTETKKRKTARYQKQLVIFEEHERVSPLIVEKEVGHPSIPRSRVKTKVESSLLLLLCLLCLYSIAILINFF